MNYVETKTIKSAVVGRETEVLNALGIRWHGRLKHIRCPYPEHEDTNPSWRWNSAKSRAHCSCSPSLSIFDVTCRVLRIEFEQCKLWIAERLGRTDLIRTRKGRGGGGQYTPSNNRATAQPPAPENSETIQPKPGGLTLEQYATAKGLTVEFLRTCGVSQITLDRMPVVRISYYGEGGEQLAVRFRIALDGKGRFRWKSGTRSSLYGLDHLPEARKAGQVVLVEGESDCHTLWFHKVLALGVPGASNWNEERNAHYFDGVETIYVVVEPDKGGEAVRKWLSRSTIRHRVKIVSLPVKDPSALYLEKPEMFKVRWEEACLQAQSWTDIEAKALEDKRSDCWQLCQELANKPSILDEFDTDLSLVGVVGERIAAKILYLAVTSRRLGRPVSVAVKGPSSGGKSFIVESTLKFFPDDAFYALTAMSDRALAYSTEPLKHRHLVIYEAAGMASDFATYLIRSLLSEGRLRYETVEKTSEGIAPRVIEREGPTGLIVTTTSLRLHPENETRMLSLTITDTREQTAKVFQALAQEPGQIEVDLTRWQALQRWLAAGPAAVAIPFAKQLADLMPALAVRLRRDFKTLLMLIRAHALLHQKSRQKDNAGQIIADIKDYTVVRDLVADLWPLGLRKLSNLRSVT